jgi:uncharacterized protein YcgI (DUF1989 family)
MELLDSFLVPKATGKAFVVKAGQILRITQPDGPQVIDFDAFSLEDPREYLLTSATRRYGPSHVTTGDTLWSGGLRERPMFTIVADTVDHQFSESGAITHDVVSGRCSQSSRNLRYSTDTPGCQEILAAAISEFGLGLEYVHDPFNIFMRTGINAKGKNFWEDPFDVKPGDYIDLRPEFDVIAAGSACPGLSSGPGSRPFGVEIYSI